MIFAGSSMIAAEAQRGCAGPRRSKGRPTGAKRAATALVLALGLLGPAVAHASEADTLFKEGRTALDAKKYDEACPKLARSQELEPGAGTLLALALCHEGQGKTATAHAELKEAARTGRAVGRNDLAQAAEKRAAAMEPALAKLAIRMPKGGEAYEVTCDGEKVGAERLDAPFPVDPGQHRIDVSGRGKAARSYVVKLAGAGVTEIVIDTLEDAPAPAAAAPARDARSLVVTSEGPAEADANRGSGQRAVGVITLVAGTGALIAGGIFVAKGLSEKSAADRICATSGPCNEQAETDGNERAKQSMNVGMISAAAGTGLLMVGALVYFTAPKGPETASSTSAKKTAARLVPVTSPTVVGLGLHGTF
jgi:hypothetical protein